VFAAGKTYTAYSSCDGLTGTLTITNVSAAPEPSTWAPIIESIGAIALVLRYIQRRRRHASQNRRRVGADLNPGLFAFLPSPQRAVATRPGEVTGEW